MSAASHALPQEAVNAKLIALIASGAIFLGVFLSGFVINEPAPYDLYMTGLLVVWALFGLRISRAISPLVVLIILFNIGGFVSMTQMADLMDTPLYLAVSLFLAFTAIFFAAVTEARPETYRLIYFAYVVAALLTSLAGIIGYFGLLPGTEMFTKYGRAAGVFQDPNVFGPFLVLPGIYLLYRLITGPVSRMPLLAIPLLIIMAGLFLSFSRGAWGLFGASAILLTGILFLQSRSGVFKLRIVVMTIVAIALLAVAMIVILQIPGVADMLSERAKLAQNYDSARLGRFARYTIGFQMALEHPLGIGPLVFGQILGEDTHNIWLKSLMDYGWLGFVSYLTLTLWTVAAGFRLLLRDRPWQPYVLCAYVVYIGHIALGTFIDTDHWRHFYLLLGLIWGGIGLEYRHQWQLRHAWATAGSRPVPGPTS
ncbi:O-antigen ligase family protein [Mesorhizobium sp. BE184]|uniref:O-antigen ligase family protein n=1 Tax=Mesorhizobium sp. BE184 TaxID=2817714 RepID=UPI00285C45A5|nr:O-antigen ligase family protein [Mesorhizobium sp. BE184]MDR7032163.1 O-antigen ligase [Mesorhizobium sp. BE184]